jgi:endonuclease-3
MLVDRFGGRVPRSMPELLLVPGVARKTANVVLGGAHGLSEGIVTDTHAMRVAQRLGLTEEESPEKIEADLCRQFPPQSWLALSHQLVLHGRYVCTARAPDCGGCALNDVCPSRQAPADAAWPELAAYEAAEMERRAEGFQRAVKTG